MSPRRQKGSVVVVHVAVELQDSALLDEPELIRRGLDEVAVVAHEDDGAVVVGEGPDEGLPGVEVQVIGGLVQDEEVGSVSHRQGQGHPGLLSSGEVADGNLRLVLPQAEPSEPSAHLGDGFLRHDGSKLLDGGLVLVEEVQVVLGEVSHLELAGAEQLPRKRLECSRQQTGQGGLAVSVGAEEGDAVVLVDAETEAAKHRPLLIVPHRGVVEAHQGGARRGRFQEAEGRLPLPHRYVNRAEALEHLQPALRLSRLGGLGAEPVHERLHPLLCGFLLSPMGLALLEPHGPGADKGFVSPRVHLELLVVEVKDAVHRDIQEPAVVAHHEQGVGIVFKVALQPRRGLQIQVVGGLVQEQQVRGAKEHRRQGHPHAPPAGEGVEGTMLGGFVETEPGQDGGGAGLGGMGVDGLESFVDFGDARRVGAPVELTSQTVQLRVRPEGRLEGGLLSPRGVLGKHPDPGFGAQVNRPAVELGLPQYQPNEGGLSGAVGPDEPHLVSGRHVGGGVVEQGPAAQTKGDT